MSIYNSLLIHRSKHISESLQRISNNVTVNFGALKLSHFKTFLQIPSMSQKINLNFKNFHATNSFSHFISSESLATKTSVKISNAIFTNYRKTPVFMSKSDINTFSLLNTEYTDSNSIYPRSEESISLEVQYCSFKNCVQMEDFSDFSTEGFKPENCGGALYVMGGVNASISVSYFENCASKSQGGAMFFANMNYGVIIKECYFKNATSNLGPAIGIYNANATISNCDFSYCSSTLNDSSSTTGTITVLGRTSEISVSYCSFTGSGFTGRYPTGYGEIYCARIGNRIAAVNVDNICISAGTPEFNVSYSQHIAVVVYNTEITPSINSINIKEYTSIYESLVSYTNNTYTLVDGKENTFGCLTIYATPMKTLDPTKSNEQRSPTRSEYPSESTKEEGPNVKIIIICICSIVGVVIVALILFFIIRFLSKDTRTAFKGEEQSAEELAYPSIGEETDEVESA